MDRGVRVAGLRDCKGDAASRDFGDVWEYTLRRFPQNGLLPSFCAVDLRFLGSKKLRACLLAQAELLDDILIAIGIVFLEVVEQAATLADHHEKSAARAVVLLVRFEVLRQLANPFA